ncbi:Repeat domain-containing protein [Lutibacter agarilyticus]|uniref:Repeat domain-containing protein n=1 Tax=Lutibacter agarilyticus TaxID=1109740 RepID=A0A238VBH0_9FLAO|nr:FG-GAP-like repeat-containing protein [Lutibacter agarilyticus]SNR31387.1 Repeat domain-containing protein [Lutibacter agarilyticus]
MYRISFLLIILALVSCDKKEAKVNSTTFLNLNAEQTNIKFSNNILENDTLNYFKFPYLYMGGGVSIGDINNDNLPDIYFTGNMTSNKLYLNKGNMQFEDITDISKTQGDKRWYTGTTMADVNNDGWLDIYICSGGKFGSSKNQLFINNGDNTYTEKAEEYGIADEGGSIQATFFDYNNDGFIDLYVGNYPHVPVSQGNWYYRIKMDDNAAHESGHLYRNNGNDTFSDVTKEAGVQNFGLTLGVVASDLNNDGFVDLFVSNDFNVPDYLYLNNGDGTFRESVKLATNQFSMFGMGSDAADFNNDGLIDIVQMEMTPSSHKRSKTNMASMNPTSFYEGVEIGFHYQYMQNSLQLNNGVYDKIPIYSNISRKAGIATTDWSWGALFADFDNDGLKDIIITNGMMRDVNNNDINNEFNSQSFFGKTNHLDYLKYPSNPIDNYVYKNNGNFTFSEMNEAWNISYKGFSNGASYADLDNDGDLDIIINNLGDFASVFENKTNNTNNNYIDIVLIGSNKNPFGLGSKVILKYENGIQKQELTLTRGFQSSVEPKLHFGLNTAKIVDEIKVVWPTGETQILKNINSNQQLKIDFKYAESVVEQPLNVINKFTDITYFSGIDFKHLEDEYNDFKFEPLIPHKNSQFGSGVAVGDVNGDGLEDFFVGNAAGSVAAMYIQNSSGKFDLIKGPWENDAQFEDMEVLLVDLDNDNDLDLYVVNGGNDKNKDESFFQDRVYLNTKNTFVKGINVLPKITSSGQTVCSGDFNKDGKLDLFVGGRIVPGKYPFPAKSYLLKNVGGKDLALRFEDVTHKIIPEIQTAGLVTSAIWDDFNNDGNLDLIIAGEWMPIRFFKNTNNKFTEVTKELGLDDKTGWWYGLQKADLDGDGDMDYLAGNLGLNYKYKASFDKPFDVYAHDFDESGSMDVVLSKISKNTRLPLRGRECSSQQIPAIKSRFETFESYANASLEDIYGKGMLKKALHYSATTFASYWIENKGGSFEMHQLPNRAQFSSINKFEVFDYNGDDYPDILLAGNLYGSEVETPRNDGSIGLVLTGNANKTFSVVPPQESNLFIKGAVSGLEAIEIEGTSNKTFLFSVNNDKLKLIQFIQ